MADVANACRSAAITEPDGESLHDRAVPCLSGDEQDDARVKLIHFLAQCCDAGLALVGVELRGWVPARVWRDLSEVAPRDMRCPVLSGDELFAPDPVRECSRHAPERRGVIPLFDPAQRSTTVRAFGKVPCRTDYFASALVATKLLRGE